MSINFMLPEDVSYEELLRENEQPEFNGVKLYTCNPAKHRKCKKQSCLWLGKGECFQTLQEEYAATEEDAKALADLYEEFNRKRETYVPLLIRKALKAIIEDEASSTHL